MRIHGEDLLVALAAGALVELSFAPERHALAMTTGGTMVGQGKFLLLIERCFLCDDDEVFSAFFVRADELDGVVRGYGTHRGERERVGGMD